MWNAGRNNVNVHAQRSAWGQKRQPRRVTGRPVTAGARLERQTASSSDPTGSALGTYASRQISGRDTEVAYRSIYGGPGARLSGHSRDGRLTDPRVICWEPAKWVARLRATMTGGGPVVLRTNMGAGHGAAAGLEEVTIAYAFALEVVKARHGRCIRM